MSTQTYTMFQNRVGYREVAPGSPVESVSNLEGRASRKFYVDWLTRQRAIQAIIGYSDIATKSASTSGSGVRNKNSPVISSISDTSIYTVGQLVKIVDDNSEVLTSTIASIVLNTSITLARYFTTNSANATKNCTITGYGYKYITRYNPMIHADYDDYLYAESVVNVEGVIPTGRSDQKVASFDEACLTVGFHSPLYGILEDDALQSKSGATYPDESSLLRNCIVKYDPTTKYQTTPPFGTIVWQNGKRTVSVNSLIMLFEADYSISWLNIPLRALPWTAMLASAGCTNLNAFGRADAPGGVMPAGTLLAMMPRIDIPHRMANGELAYDLHLRFKVYPNGANYLYRYETGRFEKIQIRLADGVNYVDVYPSIDYAAMFRAEP